MNTKLKKTLVEILGEEPIMRANKHAYGIRFTLNTLATFIVDARIQECLEQKFSNNYISSKHRVLKRTMQRRRKEFKNKNKESGH